MNTENRNDFSRCKVGDKLWSIQLGDCEFVGMAEDLNSRYPVRVKNNVGAVFVYTIDGKCSATDAIQSLFFSNPNIIAPPEPPRLPDYKPGQWIVVWDSPKHGGPNIRMFLQHEEDETVIVHSGTPWQYHCSLEELPAVLEKWGEK